MTQYDNEFFRGPPEESPTLATDQRPTGVEIFQAKPEKATAAADVPVTREEAPKDPPKKKSNARRITKAIKLLASCMAAVVITEAATNMAATIEPVPEEVPTGAYYVDQWPGVRLVEDSMFILDMDAVEGNIIQAVLEDQAWRFSAQQDWRMMWTDQTLWLEHISTGVGGRLNLRMDPYMYVEEGAVYGEVTASTGETLYFRGFLKGGGTGAPGENLELQQALLDEFFAGLTVTPATDDGWQGIQIGDKLYSQQSEDWYGLGGYGDLEIKIPWVCHSEDYGLQDKTPYAREKVNGITWSIYFTESEQDTFLWAVPNIDQGLCLGGPVSRFMSADAIRRGEAQEAAEWLEMGGSVSLSQRQTAVDILIECLQHHYALRDRWYPRDWPWKGATDDHATYWFWAESMKGKWIQFSFGDAAYRVDCTDSELRFHWERTTGTGDDAIAELEISRMVRNEEEWAIDLSVRRTEFHYVDPECVYLTAQATDGETLYLCFRPQHHGGGTDFTTAELQPMAEEILDAVRFQSNPDDSGWSKMLLCDTMHSPQTMTWSGSGIVGTYNEIRYIHEIQVEGLEDETPCATRTHNGITWSFYYDVEEEIIWAVPDLEPDVCIGANVSNMHDYYRQKYPDDVTGGWDVQYDVPYDDVNHAVEAFSECLSHIYPLGVEPQRSNYPEWPQIYAVEDDASYGFATASKRGTSIQFSFGDRAYRITSNNPALRFHWDSTQEWLDTKTAMLHVSYVEGEGERWGLAMAIQRAPFPAEDDVEYGYYAEMPNTNGEMMYLRFNSYWSGDVPFYSAEEMEQIVEAFLSEIQIKPDPDDSGWGKMLICDTMYAQQSMNWSGRSMVRDSYGIDYFHTMEYEGLWDEMPCDVRTINSITWSFYYDVDDEIIWAQPDIEPDVCLGGWTLSMQSYYRNRHPGMVTDGWNDQYNVPADDVTHAVEGLAEGLAHIYPLGMEPVEDPTDDPVEDPVDDVVVWQGLLPADFGANYGMSTWSNQNTEGIFSLGGNVFVIESYREDLRFWWEFGQEDMAAVTIYSIPEQGDEQWSAMVWIQQTPFDTYEGDPSCYRTVNLPGNESLYLRFDGDEWLADEILRNTSFDYCGKEENWHTICIGNTLQTQQSYDWTGLGMVYQDYYFDYIHNGESVDLHDQDYEGQRTINGILWTFRFHKDNGVLYAYPETEPNLGIGANPDVLWNWYDGQYGALDDYFETLVESMSVGLRQYYLLPGVVIEREPVTGPVAVEFEPLNAVQFSLGHRGYYLESSKEDAWLTWYFTEVHNGVMVADLTVGADFVAQVYITEEPLTAYDHLDHGMITVGTGDVLYWYCIELHSGDAAQLADFMGSLTASGERFASWGRVFIGDRIVTLQSLSWSGWETVETDGSGTVMMWNRERPADLELGTPIAQRKINKVVWTLYITEEYSSEKWPFIWAVPDVDPNIAIGSDYVNAVYKYYEDHGMIEDFDGDLWSAESRDGAAEVIFEVLQNYYPT